MNIKTLAFVPLALLFSSATNAQVGNTTLNLMTNFGVTGYTSYTGATNEECVRTARTQIYLNNRRVSAFYNEQTTECVLVYYSSTMFGSSPVGWLETSDVEFIGINEGGSGVGNSGLQNRGLFGDGPEHRGGTIQFQNH